MYVIPIELAHVATSEWELPSIEPDVAQGGAVAADEVSVPSAGGASAVTACRTANSPARVSCADAVHEVAVHELRAAFASLSTADAQQHLLECTRRNLLVRAARALGSRSGWAWDVG